MSTRSYVAFRDEHTTSGVYVHCDGYPAERLKVLRQIFHGAFFRDLHQMRTVLLKHADGWSLLSADPDLTGRIGARPGYLEVPGVGVAYADDGGEMTATGSAVFDEAYAYVLDMADRTLTVYEGDHVIMLLGEEQWAPIGPKAYGRRLLPITAADPPGGLCLTGQRAAYTEGHISRLMRALDLEPGDRLEIADGGDLFDFHHAATETGLLPGDTWFCTDGDGTDSEGGWIALPYDLPGAEITTRYLDGGECTPHWSDDGSGNDTRGAVRELLESMQAAIATAVRSLNTWRAELPAFVLNIRHPDAETDTHAYGYEPEVHTVDLGADFDSYARDPEQALEFAATQLTYLYHWPLRLRRIAAARIEHAVRSSEQALMLTRALARDTVSTEAVALAGSVLGVDVPGRPISVATLQAWDAVRGKPSAEVLSGYDAACRSAATGQGLDPIAAALTTAGIEHEVWQTGGFCMVAHAPVTPDLSYDITASEDGDGAGRWLVVRRVDSDPDDEGDIVGTAVPTPEVIALITGALAAVRPAAAGEVARAVNTAVDWVRDELDGVEGPVEDLLNLVVNAACYAAEHPGSGGLAEAIQAAYEGSGCTECDRPEQCQNPEHADVVAEVLGWITALA